MNKAESIFLDFCRFLAAILVLFYHAEYLLSASYLSPVASFGHDAVIFFFLLSGFVIAYVIKHKENNLRDYAIARLSRIYSVCIPAIILVVILYIVGSYMYPAKYNIDMSLFEWFKSVAINLTFLAQSGFYSIGVPTNPPYWSVSYEVWFYILFGAYFYIKGIKKYVLLCALLYLTGYRIILLFPIWVFGYCYFHSYSRYIIKSNYFIILNLIITFATYSLIRIYNIDDMIFRYTSVLIFGTEQGANISLGFSKRFLSDYLIAIIFLIAIHLLFSFLKKNENILSKYEGGIRYLSSHTFSIYLYHYPLLIFLNNVFDYSLLSLVLSIILSFAIGTFTESKKHLFKTIICKLIPLKAK